jgi:hypothetical protein
LWGGATACFSLAEDRRANICDSVEEVSLRARDFHGLKGTRLRDTVLHFLKTNGNLLDPPTAPNTFEVKRPILLGEIHGDLNVANILICRAAGAHDPFLIDFADYREDGSPYTDYVRLESDLRLRLMQSEDGSDIKESALAEWLRQERLLMHDFCGESQKRRNTPWLCHKAYETIRAIRMLALKNLKHEVQEIDPDKAQSLNHELQYGTALLHRTLLSLSSSDILMNKKILALSIAAQLIQRQWRLH